MTRNTAHNVILGILILQRNLQFTFKNLSINGINTHHKVIYFGMVTKGNSRASELCKIHILISIGLGVIGRNVR